MSEPDDNGWLHVASGLPFVGWLADLLLAAIGALGWRERRRRKAMKRDSSTSNRAGRD